MKASFHLLWQNVDAVFFRNNIEILLQKCFTNAEASLFFGTLL